MIYFSLELIFCSRRFTDLLHKLHAFYIVSLCIYYVEGGQISWSIWVFGVEKTPLFCGSGTIFFVVLLNTENILTLGCGCLSHFNRSQCPKGFWHWCFLDYWVFGNLSIVWYSKKTHNFSITWSVFVLRSRE